MIWPLILKYRVVICLAVAGLVVLGAVYNKGRIDGTAAGDRKLLKLYQAGLAAVKKRDELIAKNLEGYREELATLSARPVKRVYFCPGKVPATPGRTDSADPAGVDRRDYGPLLREAAAELTRCQTLIGVVK